MPYSGDSGGALGIGGVRESIESAKKAVAKARKNKKKKAQREAFEQSPWRVDPTGMNIAPQTKVMEKMRVAPQVTLREKASRNPGDDLDALFNQLASSLRGGGGATIDYESALRESEQAIRDAYAADIAAIRSGNKQARKQTARNRQELEQMYNALAKSYRKAGQRSSRQAQRLGDRMQANAEESSNFVGKQNRRMMNEQAQMAEDLGIEARMPAASEDMTRATNRTQRRIGRQSAVDANKQLEFGGINQRFMERGGQTAKLEGVERSGDLLENLQNFLMYNQNQIAGLKGDRGREIAQNRISTQQGVAEMQQAADSEMWDRLMGLAGLKLDIDQEKHDQGMDLAKLRQQLAGGGSSEDQFPGAENFANAEYYLSQLQRPRRGTAIFDELLKSPEFRTGQVMDPTLRKEFKLTPYQAMAMIEEMAREADLPPADVNALRLAIAAQMG